MTQAANIGIIKSRDFKSRDFKKTVGTFYSILLGFSEPEVQSCDRLRPIGFLLICAGKLRRVTVLLPVVYADVGRKFPSDFIPQPQARFQVGQPRTGAGFRIVPAVGIEFDLRHQRD